MAARLFFAEAFIALLVAACGQPAATPTPTAQQLAQIIPTLTATREPTATATRKGGLSEGTWSIVGVDVDSGEVGVALASCLGAELSISSAETAVLGQETGVRSYRIFGRMKGMESFELARLVPGVGAVVAQALVDSGNTTRLDRATARLVPGGPPEGVLEALTEGDSRFQERQYGVVTLAPDAANFTGSSTFGWAGATSGDGVTAQGNLLVGQGW